MITYGVAQPQHKEAIARLHAFSWQTHYRGMFNDTYLDHKVITDRMEVWERRFQNASKDQYVILAQEEQQLCGFGCVYLNHDQKYGALIDNLHVHQDWQGRGIGRELMNYCCEWVIKQDPASKLYLWVLKNNQSARKFYERLGGQQVEEVMEHTPGGGSSKILRVVWDQPTMLSN